MLPDFRVRQRDYLLEISRALTQELDLDKLLERILYIAAEMLAGQAGLIALRSKPGGWTVAASHGFPPALARYLEPLLAGVSDYEDPARFELPEINRLLQELARSVSLGLLTGVGLPLIARQHVIGVIFIFRNYRGVFSTNDRALLASFADQAAIAVQNAQLYKQISHEKQRMDALLDSAADGILILSSDHSITRSNPAFARMLGEPLEAILGKQHSAVVHLARREDGQTLEQAAANGWPLRPDVSLYVEGDLKRSNGAPLPVGITYAPLMTQDGSLQSIIATVRDITHFREAEQLKSTFISVISHELKTPVALIKGYADTLNRHDAHWDLTTIQDGLTVIEEEADRLGELIENLLAASKLQAEGMRLNLDDANLPLIAEQSVERFQTQTDRHTLRLDFPDDFPIICGDATRLRQVLDNLLSNAIKYSPKGGQIAIRGNYDDRWVRVAVSDQGPGVPEDQLERVFERFHRVNNALTNNTQGTGLGLYLAHAVITAHGGRIWASNNPGGGATFSFTLPRRD